MLLRREQHAALSVRARTLEIARNCVAGKIQNSRHVLLRAAREAPESADAETLAAAAKATGTILGQVCIAPTLNEVREHEEDAARTLLPGLRPDDSGRSGAIPADAPAAYRAIERAPVLPLHVADRGLRLSG